MPRDLHQPHLPTSSHTIIMREERLAWLSLVAYLYVERDAYNGLCACSFCADYRTTLKRNLFLGHAYVFLSRKMLIARCSMADNRSMYITHVKSCVFLRVFRRTLHKINMCKIKRGLRSFRLSSSTIDTSVEHPRMKERNKSVATRWPLTSLSRAVPTYLYMSEWLINTMKSIPAIMRTERAESAVI